MEHHFGELWLFGSYARGDECPDSDVDILVVSSSPPDEGVLTRYLLQQNIVGSLSYSHYTQQGLAHLLDQGALFAWHLRLEAHAIAEKSNWLADALNRIAPYRAFQKDLRVLQAMVDETHDSLVADDHTLALEASILGVALRNVAMMISFVEGKPAFSSNAIFALRSNAAVEKIFDQIGSGCITALINARLVTERGQIGSRKWTRPELIFVAREIYKWLGDLTELGINQEGYYATPISTPSSLRTSISADCEQSSAVRNPTS